MEQGFPTNNCERHWSHLYSPISEWQKYQRDLTMPQGLPN